MINDLIFPVLQIIIGGAVLGIGGFILKILWDFRETWILHQDWQRKAQTSLLDQGKAILDQGGEIKAIMAKLNGLDVRITNVEHPPFYPRTRTKHERN